MQNNNYINNIMTITDISNYLKVSERTIFRMIKRGEIPVTKISNQWRFLKDVIDEWLLEKMDYKNQDKSENLKTEKLNNYLLSDLLTEEMIITNLASGDKITVISQLIDPLIKNEILYNKEEFLNQLILREKMVSTALSKGFAVPHVRNPKDIKIKYPCIVLGICPDGVNFDSIDNEKTYLFFLLCINSESMHLKALAHIAHLTDKSEFVLKLKTIKNKELILKEIKQFEIEYFK